MVKSTASICCLALSLLVTVAGWASAGTVLITRGQTLLAGHLDGLLVLTDGRVVSRLELEVTSWGLTFGPEDLLLYDPSLLALSLYQEALIVNLPEPGEVLLSTSGKMATLEQFLEEEAVVVYDCELRQVGGTAFFSLGPLLSPDGLGDVNRDGVLDLLDVILALQVAAGINPAMPVYSTAHVNQDRMIGLEEAVHVLRQLSLRP
jgi:hypothetical protein